MFQTYRYVGPKAIARRHAGASPGLRVQSPEDVLRWVRQTQQQPDASQTVTATFVVDEEGVLRIADRRSEHVACAGGKPVLSAGEMAFRISPAPLRVSWVTNQSTGYCPEPESWPAVQAALGRAGIPAPDGFSQEFIFRHCPACRAINIVKDDQFECGVCATPLPREWNLGVEDVAERASANGQDSGVRRS